MIQSNQHNNLYSCTKGNFIFSKIFLLWRLQNEMGLLSDKKQTSHEKKITII
mgnify:CR=1 FL=1